MKKLAKVKLCDECRIQNGWHYPDDESGVPFRCPNLLTMPPARSAERERDEAIAATGTADPDGKAEVLRIVRDVCLSHYEVSANHIRPSVDAAGLSRNHISGALRRAKANGWLVVRGQVISDDKGTHAKLIDNHESLIFDAAATEERTA